MKCPACNSEITAQNINVQADIAHCPHCNLVFKLSENILPEQLSGFDMNMLPAGTWINKGMDTLVIGATTRSWIAFFIVPFMCIWSGGSLSGIYGTQIRTGHFNLFISLFGIPFVLGTFLMAGAVLMSIWGKVELTLDNTGGKIFTGVGKVGRTKRFLWEDVTTVREMIIGERLHTFGKRRGGILLEGKKRVSFAPWVNEDRRYYIIKAVQTILLKKRMNRSIF